RHRDRATPRIRGRASAVAPRRQGSARTSEDASGGLGRARDAHQLREVDAPRMDGCRLPGRANARPGRQECPPRRPLRTGLTRTHAREAAAPPLPPPIDAIRRVTADWPRVAGLELALYLSPWLYPTGTTSPFMTSTIPASPPASSPARTGSHSGSMSPEPPKSFGKSLNFGRPSRTASTFSPQYTSSPGLYERPATVAGGSSVTPI